MSAFSHYSVFVKLRRYSVYFLLNIGANDQNLIDFKKSFHIFLSKIMINCESVLYFAGYFQNFTTYWCINGWNERSFTCNHVQAFCCCVASYENLRTFSWKYILFSIMIYYFRHTFWTNENEIHDIRHVYLEHAIMFLVKCRIAV